MPQGDLRVNPETGQTYRLDLVNNTLQWAEIEGEEAANAQAAEQAGAAGAVAGGLVNSLSFGLAGASDPVMQAQQQQFPRATLAGEALGAVTPLLPALGGARAALGGARSATMAERVGQAAQQATAKKASERLIRRPSNMLGGQGTTAGSAARIVEAGIDAVPGLNLLGVGQRAFNRRIYNEGLARAMGVSDDIARKARSGITPDVRQAIRQEFAKDFDEVATAVGDNADQLASRAILDRAMDEGWIRRSTYRAMQDRNSSGDDLKQIRESISSVLRNQNEKTAVKNAARDLIEETDDVITNALGEGAEELMERYAQTRARWRVWIQARKGRGLSADNQVNPISMDGRLAAQNGIGDSYAAGEPLTNATPELNDFLELMRAGSTIETGLQSSGTAERLIGVGALGAAGAALLD